MVQKGLGFEGAKVVVNGVYTKERILQGKSDGIFTATLLDDLLLISMGVKAQKKQIQHSQNTSTQQERRSE